MFGFQTLACLHDIPVVRSSSDKLQDVYAKAKGKSFLIRLPCNVAETIADKSLKIAVTVANPLVKPLSGPVRVIDDFAAGKLRQMEAKYPVINTPTENVLNTINQKTEPVRNVINTVKDTTTSTIQHGKETVTNAATATINKATDVADTVYSFCETHVPGKTTPVSRYDFSRRTTFLWERIKSTVTFPIFYLLTWFRLLLVSFLLKIKQINDTILNRLPANSFLTILPVRFLIFTGVVLEYITARLRITEDVQTQTKHREPTSSRTVQQKQYVSRPTLKPNAFVTTRQSVVVTKEDTVITRNGFAHSQIDTPLSVVDHQQSPPGNDIDKLHAKLHATDVELLYSRLPTDVIPTIDNDQPLTEDQQLLHAKLIAADLERQGYTADRYDSYEQ